MNHNEKGKEKYHEPIESISSPCESLNVFKHLILFPEHFENLEHTCQLDKFVHSSNPSNPHDLIKIIGPSKKDIKWNNSENID